MSDDKPRRGGEYGKWSQQGVPHKGWSCVHVEDLEPSTAICEMCERQEIRYVHYMQHPDFSGELGVGCVCAGRMEDNYRAPQKREGNLQNVARRRKNWLSRQWRISNKGNHFLNTDGLNIVIFQKRDSSWGGRIEGARNGRTIFSRRHYKTREQAKLAAFDAMIFLKNCQS